MKNILLVMGFVVALAACGTPPTSKNAECLQQANDVGEAVYFDFEKGELVQLSDAEREEITQNARNECWWNKGDSKH